MPHVVLEYSGRQDEHFLDKKIAKRTLVCKIFFQFIEGMRAHIVKEDDNLPVPDLFRVEVNLTCASLLRLRSSQSI